MRIEFDPSKDALNRTKHGVSLQQAALIDWDTAITWPDTRFDYGEERMLGWGMIGERLFHVTFVERGDVMRIISLRRAEKHETRAYGIYYDKRR